MNTVTVNLSIDLPYCDIETGIVFAFTGPGGAIGCPCMKLEAGHVFLDSGVVYQGKSVRDLKCRLLQSVTITRT